MKASTWRTMSSEEKEQSWLSFIPYSLRNDRNVSDGAKVLYTFISSLCDKNGYCWASNDYLSNAIGISVRETQRRIGELKNSNYINIEAIKGEKGETIQRKIFLSLSVGGPNGHLVTNPSSPPRRECHAPHDENVMEKLSVDEDNKRKNISPYISPQGEIDGNESSPTLSSNENGNSGRTKKDDLFEEFWKEYPSCRRKVNKASCKVAYLKIPNLREEHPKILEGLRLWKEDKEWTRNDGQYIPAPLVFIHQQRWEGMFEQARKVAEEEEKKKVTDNDISAFNEEFNL